LFQFTRPAWGATKLIRNVTGVDSFNSRAPRGARPQRDNDGVHKGGFNSRAPRGARRLPAGLVITQRVSIHAPRVGRDCEDSISQRMEPVSIHAPRVGRDRNYELSLPDTTSFNSRAPRGARQGSRRYRDNKECFNSRAPRGARLHVDHVTLKDFRFQFTRPAWGATPSPAYSGARLTVSIHAPRVGRDLAHRFFQKG